MKDLDNTKATLKAQKENLDRKAEEYEALRVEANKQIENIAGMTATEAKNLLMENMKAEARSEAQAFINDTMDDARLNAAKEAKRIVITTIQRTATETAIEMQLPHSLSRMMKSKVESSDARDVTSGLWRLRQEWKS